ncbi:MULTISPECIES: TetR/AcrR family transcriptional regulator [Flavobacterium]|uniref:TetR family transcriptional regulator n=1 Tax=Flavobacterium weaverense TaxID=271156 RepID=A0A3L9ZTB1_9FLAO|nr:TetR/AcrR family transcriptional regulator [Flavobacterium weaverense]RMA76181.1 TetR family transcriptional regulator [Flavobacterium weaverense]
MALLQKSIEKRDALLKATLCLVNNGGIQEASMAKVAKLANVSPATIYLYFDSKQDMVNQLYLDVKQSFTDAAFKNLLTDSSVKENFEKIWFNMVDFKLHQKEEASFLSQCDNTPMIDEQTRQKGLTFLTPLFDLWIKGKQQGIIKELSPYLLYAFTIYPLAFLMNMENRKLCELGDAVLKDAYQAAWDSIKI